MTLGQRLRQARQEAGLSQRQLCGDTITRNMLSLIESDSAKPSMATLQYLASRLDKPVSWFLEEQPVAPAGQTELMQARSAFAQGDYMQVLQLQSQEEAYAWEWGILVALSAKELAQQAIREGRNTYALTLLQKAEDAASRTPYAEQVLQQLVLLRYQAQPDRAKQLAQLLPQEEWVLLLRAEAALTGADPERCLQILMVAEYRDARWYLLAGQAAMAQRSFAKAAEYYRGAEAAYPKQAIPALEQCYRELEDYKMAYIYACKQKQ